ncbi:hypothetical protein ABMB67_001811 [Halalkalibacter oceani]
MKFSFIEEHRSEHSVMKMCHILGVSRSGYFKWRTHQPSPQEQRKNQIQDRIAYHYHDSGRVYGSPKMAGGCAERKDSPFDTAYFHQLPFFSKAAGGCALCRF